MFDLTLAHLTYSDRERDLEARLRDRRLVEPIASPGMPVTVSTLKPTAVPRHQPGAGRIRTAAR